MERMSKPSSGNDKVQSTNDKNRPNRSRSVQKVQKQGEAFPMEEETNVQIEIFVTLNVAAKEDLKKSSSFILCLRTIETETLPNLGLCQLQISRHQKIRA